MEELLPILIGLVWLAYSFYNRNQKKKNSNKPLPAGSEDARKPSILEQILMGNESQDENIYEQYFAEEDADFTEADRTEAFSDEEPKPFLNAELSKFDGEGESIKEEREKIEIYVENENTRRLFNVGEFDLRKAVIYSEILNAPYINYK